jgi:hypothetical protein
VSFKCHIDIHVELTRRTGGVQHRLVESYVIGIGCENCSIDPYVGCIVKIYNMRFARFATSTLLTLAGTSSAFTPLLRPAARSSFRTATTSLRANVLKLTDPEQQLLKNIDVFIFDCDGVIWRVRELVVNSIPLLL